MARKWGSRAIARRKQGGDQYSLDGKKSDVILKTAMDGFWIVDRSGRIRDVNDAYCAMIGYRRDELLSLSIFDIEAKETIREIKSKIKRVGLLGPTRFETRQRRKDGGIIDVEVSAQSLSRDDGVYIAFLRDITKRKQAESMRAARTRLLMFANNHTLDELLEESLNEAEKLTGSLIGFYHFVDPGQTSLTLQTWSTRTKEHYCKSERGRVHYEIARTGVWVDCLHRRGPVVQNDCASLDYKKGVPPGHAAIIRELVVPVIRGDKIMAILGVGNKESDYDEQDIKNVSLFADLVWDIAERKIAEESLKVSEERLRRAVDGGGVGLWELDLATNRLDWNKHMNSIFGLPPDAEGPTLEKFLTAVHPDDISGTTRDFQEALERRMEFHHEYRIILPDKGVRWIVSIGRGVYDQNGKPVKMLGCALDITEKKSAEEILRLSNRILDASPEHISVLGRDYVYRHVNRAHVEAHGFPADRIIGMHVSDLLGRDVFDQLVKPLLERCLAGEEINYASWFTFRSSGRRYMSISYLPLKNKHDSINGIVVFSRDMTEHNNAEKRQQKLEEQLLQAQKMESVGRLAGGIAHDINNMLMPILAYAEMLRMRFSTGDSRREDAEAIIKSTNRVRDVTRQLLAFARKQTMELKPLSLAQIVKNFEKMLRCTIREDVRIETRYGLSKELIMGDAGQIEQVILNLAINAQDAMPEGGVICIETANAAFDEAAAAAYKGLSPGQYVMVMVSDTGTGMDEDVRGKIFEPFFTTKGVGCGTGLGLSMAYGIIKQHGGYIAVESEPGRGSRFRAYFPMLEGTSMESPEENPQHVVGGKETILIVEDQLEVLDSTAKILVAYGYCVLQAQDGETALELVRTYQGTIDLLVTDVIMPKINGKALFDEMSRVRRGLKVLYMSGYPADVISKHGVLYSRTNYIQKPFTIGAIASKIRSLLD